MRKRYAHADRDAADLDRLMDGALNVLSVIYGQIYFPTYSNGLKDIASLLGHTWSGQDASGPRSLLWRVRWEASRDPETKRDLITYKAEDCEALEVVVKTLQEVIPSEGTESAPLPHPDAIHTDSLKPESPYEFGPVDFALPEFEHINRCAYWDYQRDRVYIRSSRRLRQVAKRKEKRSKRRRTLPVNATVGPSQPGRCPKCRSPRVLKRGRSSRLLRDLKFSAGGVKRWITKYVTTYYECGNCAQLFTSDKHDHAGHRYGQQLLAYVVYSIVELDMPQAKLARVMKTLFGYSLAQSTMNRLKGRAADLYSEAHAAIKTKLLNAGVVHADETRLSTKSKAGYVWVFTSMEEVVYVWAETREGDVVREFLDGFNGVLVSDFYAAYDSIDCPQQKCLVHLIRDLNSDVTKEPFNEELRELVQDFATIVKAMIETVDRFGLKKYFLNRHKKEVGRFYERLSANVCETETARKVQDRLEKNRDKLFTFLDHDGVPWNNNNAEHAIKAFSRLRDVIQCCTNEVGVRDYLVLLSICQTCTYKGVDFLDVLRSGEMQIDEYIQRRAT